MRTLVYFAGGAYELAARCRPRLSWRQEQALRRWAGHVRDLLVCLAAVLGWALVVLVVG